MPFLSLNPSSLQTMLNTERQKEAIKQTNRKETRQQKRKKRDDPPPNGVHVHIKHRHQRRNHKTHKTHATISPIITLVNTHIHTPEPSVFSQLHQQKETQKPKDTFGIFLFFFEQQTFVEDNRNTNALFCLFTHFLLFSPVLVTD